MLSPGVGLSAMGWALFDSCSVVAAYLSSASDILSRPPANVSEAQLNAAAATLLLPKARLYAEEVVPRLAVVAAMQVKKRQVDSSPTNHGGEGTDLNAVLGEIEKLPGGAARDAYALKAARRFFSLNKTDAARAVAGKM